MYINTIYCFFFPASEIAITLLAPDPDIASLAPTPSRAFPAPARALPAPARALPHPARAFLAPAIASSGFG